MVEVEDRGGVRRVTLARVERRNALTAAMQNEVTAAFVGAEAAGMRVVVLAGAGEVFCAGLDLEGLLAAEDAGAEAARVARMFQAVWACDVPTVAAVQGAAMAGGAGLAMLCDFTVAAENAVFGFPEVTIGFVPALVGAYLSVLVAGKAARGLLLRGRRVGAEEAMRVGLVNEVVAPAELGGRVEGLVKELIGNSPASLRATKRLLRESVAGTLERALELAVAANAEARETADFREGVAAFLEKRKPDWGA